MKNNKNNKKNKLKEYFCFQCKEIHLSDNELYELHKKYELIGKYFCSLCNGYHSKGVKYNNHKVYSVNLTKQQIWLIQFKKSWNNYQTVEHKQSYGSKKQ